ncbi:hypothetical protein M8C21_008675, partial [Ambrosia artemisiifolia]
MATTKPPWSQYESVAALFKVGNREAIPDHLSDDAKDFILQCLQALDMLLKAFQFLTLEVICLATYHALTGHGAIRSTKETIRL